MGDPLIGWLTRFLKIFFDLLYHQFAWSYDLVSWSVSLGMWNDWIRAIIPEVKGLPVLELGHGPGHLQKALSGVSMAPFGLDRSPQMGKIARRRLKRSGFPRRLVTGSAGLLPFPEAHFRYVVATFPTEYLIEPQTLKEITRVLAPGGELLVIPMALITGGSLIHKAASWLFKVTGQGSELDESLYQEALSRFQKVGFLPDFEWLAQENSRVLLFRAKKPI